MILLTIALATQQVAKIDSLRLELNVPFDETYSKVASALTDNGLTITNSTPIMIEADAGETSNFLSGGTNGRIVRVILLRRGVTTTVQMTGTELRKSTGAGILTGKQEIRDQLRIDNRARGNGGRVWRKMVAVAWALDSTQVPREAIPVGDDGVLAVGAEKLPTDTGYAFVGSMKRREYYPLACSKKVDAIANTDVVWIANAGQGKSMGFTAADTAGC